MIRLASNRPAARFYRGGRQITDFRGESPAARHEPEDWVASVTTVFGEEEVGLTRLPDGRTLRGAVAADPIAWLGQQHVARWGDDPALLVKLLDAGQRLPVHAHPDDDFAATHLGHRHGKAEAWYILQGGTVHLGLRRDVSAGELERMIAAQEVEALLDLLHRVEVAPGDVVWVPPGELHAIGAGVFLVELQQPEDLSILLEWHDFAIDGASAGHLGLTFSVALRAVTLARREASDLARLIRHSPSADSLLPAAAERFFRLRRIDVAGTAQLEEAGFAVAVVIDGDLSIGEIAAPRGSTFVIAAADGLVTIRGEGRVLIARPPAAGSAPDTTTPGA